MQRIRQGRKTGCLAGATVCRHDCVQTTGSVCLFHGTHTTQTACTTKSLKSHLICEMFLLPVFSRCGRSVLGALKESFEALQSFFACLAPHPAASHRALSGGGHRDVSRCRACPQCAPDTPLSPLSSLPDGPGLAVVTCCVWQSVHTQSRCLE